MSTLFLFSMLATRPFHTSSVFPFPSSRRRPGWVGKQTSPGDEIQIWIVLPVSITGTMGSGRSTWWYWFDIGEVALSKLLDRLHDVCQCSPFLRQAILDTWRNLEESLPLHKPHLLKHLEPLRHRLGTDIAHGLKQFAKAPGATQERIDDHEGPHITEQTHGAAHRMRCTVS